MKLSLYFKIIAINLIPAFLLFNGNNDFFLNYLCDINLIKDSNNIIKYQFKSFIIGAVWVSLLLPIRYANQKTKYEKQRDLVIQQLTFYKKLSLQFIQESLNLKEHEFKTHIFVPKKDFINFFKRGTILVNKNIDGITDDLQHPDLSFKVIQKKNIVEGMVGKSYLEKVFLIDFDLNDAKTYNLTNEQEIKIGTVKFCSAIPLIKNGKTVAVLTVDSDKEIVHTPLIEKEWKKFMNLYVSSISKNIKI